MKDTRFATNGFVLLALGLAGCGGAGERPGVPLVERSDSAGVSVLTLGIEALPPPAWRIDSVPAVRIPPEGPGGAWQLYRVSALEISEAGDVWIANRGESRLLRFGPDGSFLGAAGAEGEGPGEFTSLMDLAVGVGAVLGLDFLPRRVSTFAADGTLLGDVTLDPLAGRPLEVWWTPAGLLGVSFDLPVGFESGEELSAVRRIARYTLYDETGRPVRTVAESPGPTIYMRSRQADGGVTTASISPIVQHTSRHAVLSDRLVTGFTERWELVVRGLDGRVRARIRASGLETEVTDAVWEARVEARARDLRDELGGDAAPALGTLRELAEAPRPRILPAFGRLVADGDRSVWIAPETTPAGEPRRWLVLDIESGAVASIDLPAAFALRAVRGDLVWGVERDAVEVESIVAYRILR